MKPHAPKSSLMDHLLFIICMLVFTLRATFTESPDIHTHDPLRFLTNPAMSILLSGILIGVFSLWLGRKLLLRGGMLKLSGIEWGLLLFLAAGLAAVTAAADKRLAITDLVTLAAPLLAAVVLFDLFDSPVRIRAALVLITALGILSTIQCITQLQDTNPALIESYELDPTAMLNQMGITPGTFQHMLFEHRLYSRDIKGFFTTGNSAAAFALMSFYACLALIFDRLTSPADDTKRRRLGVAIFAAAAVVILVGMVLTESKGGIGAFLISLAAIGAWLLAGKFIRKYRRELLVLAGAAALVLTVFVIRYGITHGRLPGGNSMLVRWQYWTATAEMIKDHPVTGVGGANFGLHYTRYKNPAAPEEVRDPHNMILALLSEYGPAGLAGFFAALLIPYCRLLFARPRPDEALSAPPRLSQTRSRMPEALFFLATLTLVFIRPVVFPSEFGNSPVVMVAVYLILYGIPASALIIACFVLWRSSDYAANLPRTLPANALACLAVALPAVLLHNLVDFAIFEPGNYMLLWILSAILFRSANPVLRTFTLTRPRVMAIALPAGLLSVLFMVYSFIPTLKAGRSIQRAYNDIPGAHEHFERAAKADPLSPHANVLNASLYLQQANPETDQALPRLLAARENLLTALERCAIDYKSWDTLSEVCVALSLADTMEQTNEWYEKALQAAQKAVKYYPGSGRLHLSLAKIADRLHRTDLALEHYKKAVAIEDAYRVQFAVMYPGRELFSRLGQANYLYAKERIELLKAAPPTP